MNRSLESASNCAEMAPFQKGSGDVLPDEGEDVFRLERHLVEAFVPAATRYVSGAEVRYQRREVELGRRIADVVAWGYQDTPPDNLASSLRRTSIVDLALLAHLLERPLSSRSLARRIHADLNFVMGRMSLLCRTGLVDRTSRTVYRVTWHQCLPRQVVAFEVKLSDWREAVRQAHYYSRFADAAWVVLPCDRRLSEAILERCRLAGVGLLQVGLAKVRPVVTPKICQGSPYNRRLLRLRLVWGAARRRHNA